MGHKHDTNGNREGPYSMFVGDEHVTYYKVYCTCGKYMTNDIVSREK
jgi:hypothetical protein